MKYLHCCVAKVASAAFFIACSPTFAQWQTPDHSVPIGRGAGTGFKSAAPGTAGLPLVSNGPSADPSFQLLTSSAPTPYNYGAVGDGVADDTAAMQAWITAGYTNKTALYCSPGKYKIKKTLNLTGVGGYNAINIFGAGGNSCNIAFESPPVVTVSGAVAGPSYTPAGGGPTPSIRLTVSSTANIGTAVYIDNGLGGTTEARGTWPTTIVDATHVDIIGPTFTHAYTSGGTITLAAFALNPNPVCNNGIVPCARITGLFFSPPTTANVHVMAVTGGDVIYKDNIVNGYARGLTFSTSYAWVVDTNWFYNLSGSVIISNQDVSANNAKLINNKAFSVGNIAGEAAFNIGGNSEGVVIENNEVAGAFGGILLTGAAAVQIRGNYLENNSTFNLYCEPAATNRAVEIVGNWFNNNAGLISTSLNGCHQVYFNQNWLSNQLFNFNTSQDTVVGIGNLLSGSSAIIEPATLWKTTSATTQCSSGSLTGSTSLSLQTTGKTVMVSAQISVSNAAGCGGYVQIQLPFTAATASVASCRNVGVGGKSAVLNFQVGNNVATVFSYDNSNDLSNGAQFDCGGVVQKQ